MKLRIPARRSSVANRPEKCSRLDLQAGGQADIQAVVDRLLGGLQRQRGAGRVACGHVAAG